MKRKWPIYVGLILLIVILDQITKAVLLYLITGKFVLFGSAWSVVSAPYLMRHISNFFNIVFTWNFGTSFSLFQSLGEAMPLVIIIITGLIIAVVAYYLFARAPSFERVPLSLIVGGAIGNLVDRIRFGAVIDFLDFYIGSWHWPAFNFADSCITIGIILFVINFLLQHSPEFAKIEGNK